MGVTVVHSARFSDLESRGKLEILSAVAMNVLVLQMTYRRAIIKIVAYL